MSNTVVLWVRDHVTPFQIFKYVIYALLIRNIFLFYYEETAAAAILETDGVTWAEFIDVFAATIDTLNWVILLLLFEFETWIIPDDKLTPTLQRAFTVVRGICYAWIIYAVYGYIVNFFDVLKDWQPLANTAAGLCAHIGHSFMFSLDRFIEVTAGNCTQLAMSSDLHQGKGLAITDDHHYHVAWMLALADVINSITWVLVVVILEVEVWMQNKRLLNRSNTKLMTASKGILYSTLFAVAVFWWMYGEFLDFWDAFLWIVAFLFIESNIIEWNKEQREPTTAVAGD